MTNEFKEGVHAMSESRVTRSITLLCSAYTGEQLQHAGISDMADIARETSGLADEPGAGAVGLQSSRDIQIPIGSGRGVYRKLWRLSCGDSARGRPMRAPTSTLRH